MSYRRKVGRETRGTYFSERSRREIKGSALIVRRIALRSRSSINLGRPILVEVRPNFCFSKRFAIPRQVAGERPSKRLTSLLVHPNLSRVYTLFLCLGDICILGAFGGRGGVRAIIKG